MYFIKTRNWYARKWVKALLDLTPKVQRGDHYDDGDAKYCLSTSNAFLAWSVWTYWQMLKPLSGGWTYIVRPGHELSGRTYANIY